MTSRPTPRLLERLWPAAASAAAEVAQTVFYEILPSAQLVLPHIGGATYADREALTHVVLAELVPDILRIAGAPPRDVQSQVGPGGFELKTSVSIQSHVHLDDAETDRVAAALGWVFRQESVLVADLDGAAQGRTRYVIADFTDDRVTPALADAFFQHAATIDRGLGEGYTAFGDDLLFLNVRGPDGAPYSNLDDAAFDGAMSRAAESFAGARVKTDARGRADARFVENDWKAAPEGEGYAQVLGAAVVASLAPLQARHSAMVLEAARRYGWG